MPEGLSVDRQWYLFDNIRSLVSERARDIFCPKSLGARHTFAQTHAEKLELTLRKRKSPSIDSEDITILKRKSSSIDTVINRLRSVCTANSFSFSYMLYIANMFVYCEQTFHVLDSFEL